MKVMFLEWLCEKDEDTLVLKKLKKNKIKHEKTYSVDENGIMSVNVEINTFEDVVTIGKIFDDRIIIYDDGSKITTYSTAMELGVISC